MPKEKLSRKKIILILAGIMTSLLLSALDSTVVSTAMKRIAEDMSGMDLYSWPFTAYMLCSTIAIPVCGSLADIYGHKPMFITGIAIFLSGSMLCGSSQSMMQLIVFRGLQGIGGGMIVSGVFTAVADIFEPAQRGRYTGIVTSMYGLASIIGPAAGGFVTDTLGWRFIFFMNIPLGITAVVLIAFSMPGYRSGERKKADVRGMAFLVLALLPVLLAFSMAGNEFKWISLPCICMLTASAVMAVLFIFSEKRSENPVMPLYFFRDRAIGISFVMAFFSQAIMFSAIMYLPYFIQGVIGSTAAVSGAVITPMMLGLLLASNLSGQIVSRAGKARVLSLCAFAVMGTGAFLLSGMGVDTAYGTAIIFMVILGFGVGMSMPVTNVNAQNAVPGKQISSVTASVMFFRNIGSTVGSAAYGAIMAVSLKKGFAGIDMHYMPVRLQALMKDLQVITSAKTVASVKSRVPGDYTVYFDKIYFQTKEVLANSIHSVFLLCVGLAAAGFLAALFLREASLK